MKKLLSSFMAAALVLSLAGCGAAPTPPAVDTPPADTSLSVAPSASPSAPESNSTATTPADKVFKIGIIQLAEHAALDAAKEGFVAGLKEAGFEDGKNITIDFQNAQGEQPNCVTIAEKLINDKSDLILAIATPAAQAVANKTTEIPLLITAVTDPASAKLVKTNEAPGGNVTGTSDLNPIEEQMNLLKTLVPDAKKVAILFCSSEANSEFQAKLATEQLKTMGIQAFNSTVSNANEIQQVIQSLQGKADAIYCPTDNVISAAMSTVAATAQELKLPVIVGEPAQVELGGLATQGLSYFNLGKQTAAMAVRILKDGAKPGEMPIEYLKETELVINQDAAAALGLTIPAELAAKARMVKK